MPQAGGFDAVVGMRPLSRLAHVWSLEGVLSLLGAVCLWGNEAVYLQDNITSCGDIYMVVISLRRALEIRSSLARRSARAVGGPSVDSMRAVRSKWRLCSLSASYTR